MNAKDGASLQGRAPQEAASRSGGGETTLKAGQIQIERKNFSFALRENLRGRFLCITEESRAHHDQIIVPAPGLAEFKRVIEVMIQAAERPAPAEPSRAVHE